MSPLLLILTFLTGTVAGFLNVVGGGGSLLTLPLLVFLGLDMGRANATNRVAIFLQNMVATWRFYREGVLSLRRLALFVIPACAGSFFGALFAVQLNPRILQLVIAALISIMACLLLFRPSMWEAQDERELPVLAVAGLFTAIGLYGGFVQAGVGFFFIWALVGAMGMDLLHANAVKVAVVFAYTGVSLVLFSSHGLVDLRVGLILAVGNMTGAVAATRFSVSRGNRWIRWILSVTVVISAIRLFLKALVP